jgi:imidazolonepropionase-like amidohydrolase
VIRGALAAVLVAALLPAQEHGVKTVWAKRLYVGDGAVSGPVLITIEGGKIASVVPAAGDQPKTSVAASVENAWVTPGFVEGSSSVGLPRGLAENEEGSEVTACVHASTVIDPSDDGFRRMREAGVTTLVVSPGNRNVIGGLSVAVKAKDASARGMMLKDDVALHAVLGPEPAIRNTSPRNGSQSMFARRPNSRMGVVYELRRALQEGCELNEHAPMGKSCFCEADGKVLAAVMKGDIPLAFVAHAEQDITTAFTIADEFKAKNFYLDGAVEAYLERDLLARRNIPALIGPVYHSSQLIGEPGGGGGGGRRRQREQQQGNYLMTDKGGILGGPKLLRDAGVRFGLSEGSSEMGATLLDFAQGAVRGGLAPGDAIAAISGWPAAIVGLGRRVGVVAAGKDADLCVFDGDPLVPTSRLVMVMIDGEVVFEAKTAAEAPATRPATDSRRN